MSFLNPVRDPTNFITFSVVRQRQTRLRTIIYRKNPSTIGHPVKSTFYLLQSSSGFPATDNPKLQYNNLTIDKHQSKRYS